MCAMEITGPTVVKGDFEFIAQVYRSSRFNAQRGKEFIQWTERSRMQFTGKAGVPIYEPGGIFNMVCSNTPFAITEGSAKLQIKLNC